MIKRIVRIVLYYIIGLLIFTAVLYLTQNLLLNLLGLGNEDIDIYLDGYIITAILYTALYAIINVGLYIYDRVSVKRLNEKLEQMKERVKINEEAIRSYSSNNNYTDGSFVRGV